MVWERALAAAVGDVGVLERSDQGLDVVSAEHGAEDLDCADLGNQRAARRALQDLSEESGFHFRSWVDARGYAVLEEIQEQFLLPRRG